MRTLRGEIVREDISCASQNKGSRELCQLEGANNEPNMPVRDVIVVRTEPVQPVDCLLHIQLLSNWGRDS